MSYDCECEYNSGPMAAAAAIVLVLACAPYDHHDPAELVNVSARFGAPYTIASTPPPTLSERLAFTASYEATPCTLVDWSVDVDVGHALGNVLVVIRHERSVAGRCNALTAATAFRGRVQVDLPATDRPLQWLLAFPPGSEYELYRLSLEALPPAPLAGLAPPCPSAALRLYVHRAIPKYDRPNGPCSTLVEVLPSATLGEVAAVASARLGIDVAALREEGSAAGDPPPPVLTDEMHLVALEHEPLQSVTMSARAAPPPAMPTIPKSEVAALRPNESVASDAGSCVPDVGSRASCGVGLV